MSNLEANLGNADDLSGGISNQLSAAQIMQLYESNSNVKSVLFNVKGWCAVGDGVTDDTAAIQAAIDSFGAYAGAWMGGGIDLYFPPGIYLISHTIIIENNCKIVGAGSDQGTMISLADNSNCDMFQIGLRSSSDPMSVWIEGIKFYMDRTTNVGNIANIRTYNYIRHSHFRDLFFFGSPYANFIFEQEGAHFSGRNNYFYGCAFEDADTYGVFGTHSYNLNFDHSYFGFGISAGYIGVYISMSAQNFHLSNCWFLNNCNYNGIFLPHATNNFFITNNYFRIPDGGGAAGSSAIAISDATYNGIIANNIIGINGVVPTYTYIFRLNASQYIKVHDNMYTQYATSFIHTTDATTQYLNNNTDIT